MLFSALWVLFIMSAIVGTVARTPVEAGAALKFFNTVGKLKTLKRTGWVNNAVFEPESVADHMYRMSMLGFLITDPAVNKDRLIKVCLIHDLAESIVGDITPYDGVSKDDKRKLEQDAMKLILDGLGNQEIAAELMSLWMEYEEGDSIEADVARQLDKYEMIIQVCLL
jgi:putative hydrolases of HD superfamily